jgi:hypothetical protein
MTDLEDLLRTELATVARRVDPARIRPLREPPARARRRAAGWLAPAAAAAAVTVVVLGLTFAGRLTGHGAATGPAAGVPRYYLTVADSGPARTATAAVHDAATGAVLARARIPVLGGTPSVTGASDGRTFVVVDNTSESAGARHPDTFYRARVESGGHVLRVTRLAVALPAVVVDSVALSPDGSSLAVAEQSCRGGRCQYTQVQVLSLVTGSATTWRTRAVGAPWNLSWAADGQRVGFLWESGLHAPPPAQRTGYRLLNVVGPGGDLLAPGPVVTVPPNPGGDTPAALVTPDGQGFVSNGTRVLRGLDHRVTVATRVVELSASTGRVRQVLYTASARGVPRTYGNTGTLDEQGCTVLSLDPAGQHPLVRCFLFGRFSFGMLARGHLQPLPGVPNPDCARDCRGPMWGTAAW